VNVLLMYEPSDDHRAQLERAAPGAELLIADDEGSARRLIAGADAVLGNRYFLQSLPRARHLRWMQSNSMGVDLLLAGNPRLREITLTCARGLYADEVAEHAVALVMALLRGLHYARDNQHARRWQRMSLRTIAGSRVLVIGWGSVGRAVGQRLRVLGAHVQGVRRAGSGAPAEDAEGFIVHNPQTWRASLPETDVVVLALPLTGETRALISAAELAALPGHALLVNVGRGATVDETALLRALEQERLAGAALDVLEEEPPPAAHALWSERRLLLTPHVARSLEVPPYRWESLFVENLRRFALGEPLLNVVDAQAGY
jgi:phosphoglycerate dehydrogenase-like enzyme